MRNADFRDVLKLCLIRPVGDACDRGDSACGDAKSAGEFIFESPGCESLLDESCYDVCRNIQEARLVCYETLDAKYSIRKRDER